MGESKTGESKKPDLRNGEHGALSEGLDERQAGAEPEKLQPHPVGHMLRPGVGGKVPDGQSTKSS